MIRDEVKLILNVSNESLSEKYLGMLMWESQKMVRSNILKIVCGRRYRGGWNK
jgi:hypothetical protein